MNSRRFAIVLLSLALLLWTLIVAIYHVGVFPKPQVDWNEQATGQWMDHNDAGINQLILQGPAFARGRKSGELTGPLLLAEEEQLVNKLEEWLPSKWMLQMMVLGASTWFQGIEHYIPPADIAEMYGVSLSAPKQFDYLADGFTRQVAYHGLHEVGQMMVDQGFDDMGCTLLALPYKTSFVIGRNFDFEAGRIFDSEKILKWVFPDEGHAFVSVIWAGMVGAVTGINDQGVYISINAAGSSDHSRLGTPSTLVALDVLQHAADVPQALKILEQAQMFITDIFVVMDASGTAVRVEKSPARTQALPIRGRQAVTNHLVSAAFADDPINKSRMSELTTLMREKRGRERLEALPAATSSRQAVDQVLSVLRDKGVDSYGQPLPLGNRRAIDALIATHSVIWDPIAGLFYVSQGPAVSGPFLGYDLKKSFAKHHPVEIEDLPADPAVREADFLALKEGNQKIAKAAVAVHRRECQKGADILASVAPIGREQTSYAQAMGDIYECLGRHDQAREQWTRGLALNPAYARQVRDLEERLKR